MSGLSAFDDCGLWSLSGDPNPAEDFYNLLPSLWGEAIDQTPGTYDECKLYAWAMGLGRVMRELEHAGNQAFPDVCYELLPLHEIDYQLTPGANDSVPTRQAALLAKMQLPQGYTLSNVVNTLKSTLGTVNGTQNLLSFSRTSDLATPTVYPSSPGAGPGNFVDVRVPQRFLKLVDSVATRGAPVWCAYQALDTSAVPSTIWVAGASFVTGTLIVPTSANATGYYYEATVGGAPSGTTEPAWPTSLGATVVDGGITWTCTAPIAPPLKKGDVIVVQGECSAVAEQVTVSAVSYSNPAGSNATPGYLYFQATFNRGHDAGATVVAGNFPYWWSTQRQVFVIAPVRSSPYVTVTRDRNSRRKVDELLGHMARAVDTWAFVEAATTTTSGGTVGPLTVGAPIGCAPIGSFTFTNSN